MQFKRRSNSSSSGFVSSGGSGSGGVSCGQCECHNMTSQCRGVQDNIGYPRMSASGESSTTMHRLLHASGPHPIPPPDDPKTNQYNQDLGLIHSTSGNHLESPNEGSSIDHNIGYPRMSASGESSTTMHRLLHASGPHPIPPPDDPKTNQYNQDLGLIHSTSGNHLESPNEGSSIDHQVTIHLHAQNITMLPTNETWYFASQMLVSSSGGLILV
ncbi:hypothetical protein F511_26357 [Dorcoceras hygrometricum]|uniref:Uncharacterized protein n=1 Tax=Dorcoceras hygrometricum TaxID=472368 RepID=A0A2Z7ABR5_9LAMI|nr:hypothetical protein F511_26357 [Dorcoceras hygrometricum]